MLIFFRRLGTTGSGIFSVENVLSLQKESVQFLVHHLDQLQQTRILKSVGFEISKTEEREKERRKGDDEDQCIPQFRQFGNVTTFGIEPFYIECGGIPDKGVNYSLCAPTTSRNVSRLLRGMQLPKPLLLEGSPGVGKSI